MAPRVPEELDVFTIPHSRMKELVSGYVEKLEKTNFSNYVDMQQLLSSLSEAFQEFKKHEQIENNLIMKKLKNKLKQLSIRNTAVCNCHKDSHLTEILHLVQDGYTKKTVQDRVNYGLALRKKLEDFTEDFLPHMQQEEEVFQPLLLQYFTYKELCELRKTVIQLHLQKKEDSSKDPWNFLKHLRGNKEEYDEEEEDKDDKDDYCEYLTKDQVAQLQSELEKDNRVEKKKKERKKDDKNKRDDIAQNEAVPPDKTELENILFDKNVYDPTVQDRQVSDQVFFKEPWNEKSWVDDSKRIPDKSILDLPNEIMLKVMTYLRPKDLGNFQQVCRDWSVVAKDPSLWRELHPVKWAKGEWDYKNEVPLEDEEDEEEEEESGGSDGEQYILIDEDADIDESCISEEENVALKEIRHEAKMLSGLVKHVLPSVGQGVRVLNLGHSRALTSGLLHRMLKCCPNVEYLDLTQSKISDAGLKGLGVNNCGSQLKKLILSGCVNITDTTLMRLAAALSRPTVRCRHKVPKKKFAPPDRDDSWQNNHQEVAERAGETARETAREMGQARHTPFMNYDIENLHENLPEKFNSVDKLRQDDKHLNLAQIAEDYCISVEYQDAQRLRAPPYDSWVAKEHSIWDNYIGSNHLGGDRNHERGRMKEPGGQDCSGPPGSCSKYADGLCCQDNLQDNCGCIGDEGIRREVDRGQTRGQPPPGAFQGDGPPNVVIARDKAEGQQAAAVAMMLKKDCSQVSVMGCCHEGCKGPIDDSTQLAIEECAAPAAIVPTECAEQESRDDFGDYNSEAEDYEEGSPTTRKCQLQYLSLSGCYQVTDFGLSALADCGTFGEMYGLDLSGCAGLTGPGIEALVNACPSLDPELLYYCDNIVDGPLVESASGCRNQQCGARYCCRMLLAQ